MIGPIGFQAKQPYQGAQRKSIRQMDLSFRDSMAAARPNLDTWGDSGGTILSPDAGAPTLQWLYDNYVKGSAPANETLSDEQIAALAKEFNPEHMTQSSFDSFVNALVDMGAFTREELHTTAYGRITTIGQYDPEDTYLPYQDSARVLTTQETTLRDWARTNESLLHLSAYAPDGPAVFSVATADTIMRLMPILERISEERGK